MKFKQGDRVAGDFYDAAQGQYVRVRGTYYDDGWVKSGASSLEWHCAPNSIRKLKPRAKSVMVTRKMLAEAWDGAVAPLGHGNPRMVYASGKCSGFACLSKALGLE